MAKNNNKGFSLIEVIIAIAVFAILIIPLTTQLVTATKTNSSSKKKQYAVEKAEEIMESMKTAELGGTISIPDGNDSGNYDFTLDTTSSSVKTQSTSIGNVSYNVSTYKCSDISLGTDYAKYDCTVTISDLPYAVSSLGYIWDSETGDVKMEGSTPVTTSSAVGTVRNLDNDQYAIITGATYMGSSSGVTANNLDNQAYDYFLAAKVDWLSQKSTVGYNQYKSGNDYFVDDYFEKNTTIKVSKTATGTYLVQCLVEYTDHTQLGVIKTAYENSGDNVYKPDNAFYGEGIVYQQEYDELPPIYLLYVPAIYSDKYCDSDYITIDTSEIGTEEVSIYLFETAADISSTYSTIICDYFSEILKQNVTDVSELVYSSAHLTLGASDVDVVVSQSGGDSSTLSVFSNFTTSTSSTVTVLDTSQDTSDDVYLYDITVTLTYDGNTTTISGTRGK